MKRSRAANSLMPSLTCLMSPPVGGAAEVGGGLKRGGGGGGGRVGGEGAGRGGGNTSSEGMDAGGLNSCGYFGVGISRPWFLLASFKKDKCR